MKRFLLVVAVLVGMAWVAEAQGPFSAQIQRALASFSSGASPFTAAITTSGLSVPAVANVGANSCGTSAAAYAGNDNAGKITVGATSGTQCRIGFTRAAPVEWDCIATDATQTIATRATPVDTTHADVFGAFAAADVVVVHCLPR